MRGRKPKSTEQKRLEGNLGKRPLNEDEPQPPALAPDPFDEPPPEMQGDHELATIAAAEWRRLAPMLRTIRQVTEADRGALLALCLEWARYIVATKKVREQGLVLTTKSGYPITNPYLPIATKALQLCNKLWPELGLTPSSRSRVKAAPEGPEADPFAEFLQPLADTHGERRH